MEKQKEFLLKVKQQELEDIWSALSYFIMAYPTKESVETKKAMRKIMKTIRTAMKESK